MYEKKKIFIKYSFYVFLIINLFIIIIFSNNKNRTLANMIPASWELLQ